MTPLRSSIKLLQKYRPIVFLKKALKFVASKAFSIETLIIYELDIEGNVRNVIPLIELSYVFADKNDLETLNDERYGYNVKGMKYCKERMALGDKCALALHDGEVVGYIWMMQDKMELSKSNLITLSKNRRYIYKGFVVEELRGKRVLSGIDNYLIEIMRRDSKRFIVTWISEKNKSSIKQKERLGYKEIGRITQLKLFGFKYDYISKKDLLYLQTP